MRDERCHGRAQTIKRHGMVAGYWSVFRSFSAPASEPGNVSSARIGYNLILARSTPPPSIGKASFVQGHFDHRTNCSSTKHKEGLRKLLAPGGSFDEAVRA